MRSCFSKAVLLAAAILPAACSFKKAESERIFLPRLATGGLLQKLPSRDEATLLTDLYEPTEGVSACDWLANLSETGTGPERFRLLGDWRTPDVTDELQISELSGAVDIAASPLYQYALLTQQIPDKREFLALLDQEFQRAVSFGDVFKIGAVRALIKIGILNPYGVRNSVIQSKMDEALPGSFEQQEREQIFLDTIPGAVFQNGNPGLVRLSFTADEPAELKRKKLQQLGQTLDEYKRPQRIFSEGGWTAFSRDMKTGLSAAIRSFRGSESRQLACGTAILHRTFAQLLTIMGFPRLPLKRSRESDRGVLPDFEELLVNAETEEYSVCAAPGSFLKEGRRVLLSRDDIASTGDSAEPSFVLSAKPFVPQECRKVNTGPLTSLSYVSSLSTDQIAPASELLAFLSGVTNFVTAFNPGAPWWSETNLGFPLSPFESMEKIRSSGAILPADSHALSLGFLNLAFDVLLKKHLVYIGPDNKEVLNPADAVGIRISEAPRKPGAPGKVRVTIGAVSELTETAFKLSHYLSLVRNWKQRAEVALEEELAAEKDFRKRIALRRDFDDFIAGMFASEDVLGKLGAAGEGSLAAQVQNLKLAITMLSISFSHKGNGFASCHAEMIFDPESGEGRFQGECSPDEERSWRYGLALAARSFRSPILQELAEGRPQ